MDKVKFEEYKLFVEDTARFSERRQTVSNIYVAVNTIILAGIALLIEESGFISIWQLLLAIPLLLAGIFICSRWSEIIEDYRRLVNFRIRHLEIMEGEEGMKGSHQMYREEGVELFGKLPVPVISDGKEDSERDTEPVRNESEDNSSESKKNPLGFSVKEQGLPRTFIKIYWLFVLVLIASLAITIAHPYLPEKIRQFITTTLG